MSDHALYVFGPRSERFARSGIKLVLNSRVKAVQDGRVTVVDKEGNVSRLFVLLVAVDVRWLVVRMACWPLLALQHPIR